MNIGSEQHKSLLHGLILLFEKALKSLGKSIGFKESEEVCVAIFNSMEARWRRYHCINHALTVANSNDPIQVLAGLFHDTVYLQVDRRIHPKLRPFLLEFSEFGSNYSFSVPGSSSENNDQWIAIINDLFGFTGNRIIDPSTGANEYLSAIVAARTLSPYLDPWNIIQVAACIELTIPFRQTDEDGKTPPELLEQRLRQICSKYGYPIDLVEIRSTVKAAVDLANRDVASFAAPPGEFLGDTWQLILEGNPVFKSPMFTVRQIRMAFLRIEKFYSVLSPELIFSEFDSRASSVSSKKELTEKARTNLKLGREYFQIKLVTMAILEAIAELSGGDGPLVLFIGQVGPDGNFHPIIVEHFLDWNIRECDASEYNERVLGMLSQSLYSALSRSSKKVSISSYLYVRLSRQTRLDLYDHAKKLFDGNLSHLEYLKKFLDPLLCKSIINAVAQMATSRRRQILHIKAQLNLKS